MGQFLLKTEESALPFLYPSAGGTYLWSACKSTNGHVYYIGMLNAGDATNSIYKSDASGNLVRIANNIGLGWYHGFYTVSYFNGSFEELHFVCPTNDPTNQICRNDIVIINTLTDTFSVTAGSGLLIPNVNVGDNRFDLEGREEKLKFVMVNGSLWYVYSDNTNLKIQYYSPSTRSWITSLNVNMTGASYFQENMDSSCFTVGAKGDYIYIMAHAYYNGGIKFARYDTVLGNFVLLSPVGMSTTMFRKKATTFTNGDDIYFIGGCDANNNPLNATTILRYNITDNTIYNTGQPNVVRYTKQCSNAIDIGGELFIAGGYDGANLNTMRRFTYLLSDITNFTAAYFPSPTPKITLNWTDVIDESFYIIERKVDTGEWTKIVELAQDVTTYDDTNSIDLSNHTYSYRIKSVKVMTT
jgi:hypothetical protein